MFIIQIDMFVKYDLIMIFVVFNHQIVIQESNNDVILIWFSVLKKTCIYSFKSVS